jgi:ubiquinone biosynthesis monooxygenase Coq6
VTSGLKVALIEGQDLEKNKLTNASLDVFSNRCSSLTPASVKNMKGTGNHIYRAISSMLMCLC